MIACFLPRPSLVVALVVLLYLVCVVSVDGSGRGQWSRFMRCITKRAGRRLFTKSGRCASYQMIEQFRKMQNVRCKNCDKYFHCRANYLAVKCPGKDSYFIAKLISNCREYSQPGNAQDSREDQIANEYGRSGKSCEARYLKRYKCAYRIAYDDCRW